MLPAGAERRSSARTLDAPVRRLAWSARCLVMACPPLASRAVSPNCRFGKRQRRAVSAEAVGRQSTDLRHDARRPMSAFPPQPSHRPRDHCARTRPPDRPRSGSGRAEGLRPILWWKPACGSQAPAQRCHAVCLLHDNLAPETLDSRAGGSRFRNGFRTWPPLTWPRHRAVTPLESSTSVRISRATAQPAASATAGSASARSPAATARNRASPELPMA